MLIKRLLSNNNNNDDDDDDNNNNNNNQKQQQQNLVHEIALNLSNSYFVFNSSFVCFFFFCVCFVCLFCCCRFCFLYFTQFGRRLTNPLCLTEFVARTYLLLRKSTFNLVVNIWLKIAPYLQDLSSGFNRSVVNLKMHLWHDACQRNANNEKKNLHKDPCKEKKKTQCFINVLLYKTYLNMVILS